MASSTQIVHTFFHDLKKFNSTNFRTIEKADLSIANPTVHKAFSSVVTRYFIFCEKHTEFTEIELRILYFKLKIDLISRYFSEYPDVNLDQLKTFQVELLNYIKDTKGGELQHGCLSAT